MENPMLISNLNDFIFCPVSIYFHNLYGDVERLLFQEKSQVMGTHAHNSVDSGNYSTRKTVLQGFEVYSEQYNLIGKIDLFDSSSGTLTERKKKIKTIYDGYIFQIYAQYFCLREMGYDVRSLRLYSMDDNRSHKILLPEENVPMFEKFLSLLDQMNQFEITAYIQQNPEKCARCIYEPICGASIFDERTEKEDYDQSA